MAQINKPSEYFNTKLWTGTGAENAITGVGFQPDWVWVKRREIKDHNLYDAVRGATKFIESNTTDAEATDAQTLKSFDSDGFTLGTSTNVNANAGIYASWNWLANGSGVSNTDGSITSTVSANTTSGFSVVTYTGNGTAGATVGHGLGSVPKTIFVKRTDTTGSWIVYHSTLGATKYMVLNSTDAETTDIEGWNNTEPTSSVFSLGIGGAVNASGGTYVAYVFSEKKGFSKFGSYTGNGNADGPFVYTGFKPAWVLVKDSTQIQGWGLFDNKRIGYNPRNNTLSPSDSVAEYTSGFDVDILSNGFKVRTTDALYNYNGSTYIYMAFAENPLVGTNNIPACAR